MKKMKKERKLADSACYSEMVSARQSIVTCDIATEWKHKYLQQIKYPKHVKATITKWIDSKLLVLTVMTNSVYKMSLYHKYHNLQG